MNDRNIYDVMNEVDAGDEYMDMSIEETDACVNRLKNRLKSPVKTRRWQKAAACVTAALVLSGGGLAYAAGSGSLTWFYGANSAESGIEIPSKYVDKNYVNDEYKGSVKVTTDSEANVSFDIRKAAVSDEEVNITMVVTYDDFDNKKYDGFSVSLIGIIDAGDDIVRSGVGSERYGDGADLAYNQMMFDMVYKLKKKNAYKVGDTITLKCDSVTMHDRQGTHKSGESYEPDEVTGPWILQVKIQDEVRENKVDVSDFDAVEKCWINAKGIEMDIAENGTETLDTDAFDNIILEMSDNNKLKKFWNSAGAETDSNGRVTKYTVSFGKPIDISKVKAVWIDGVRCLVE